MAEPGGADGSGVGPGQGDERPEARLGAGGKGVEEEAGPAEGAVGKEDGEALEVRRDLVGGRPGDGFGGQFGPAGERLVEMSGRAEERGGVA